MRIFLFGLTGFGNSALRAIRRAGGELAALITRREAGEFPYYREKNIAEEAREAKIPVFEELDLKTNAGIACLRNLRADIVIVSSFHKKIPLQVICLATQAAINIHPSLLPSYRGATPTSWCLMHGENKTGVTAHHLSEQIDQGPIIAQKEIAIDGLDTNGTLRRKLAQVTENLVTEIILRLASGEALDGRSQDESRMSYYPRWTRKNAFINFNEPVLDVYNRIRASSPYPASYTTFGGQEIVIKRGRILQGKVTDIRAGQVIANDYGLLTVAAQDGLIQIETDETREFRESLSILGT